MIPSAMTPDFMPRHFMPTGSVLRDFMLPDFALSISMRPQVMTWLADLCFGKLIPAISFLAIQVSAPLLIRRPQESRVSAGT
jgi:hypothetical protein